MWGCQNGHQAEAEGGGMTRLHTTVDGQNPALPIIRNIP